MPEINENNKELTIPKNITLDNYTQSFKDFLTKNYYSYRCKHRNKCSFTIKIHKDEILNLENNNNNITYIYTSKNTEHICNEKTEHKIETTRVIKPELKNIKEMAYTLIYTNLNKPA